MYENIRFYWRYINENIFSTGPLEVGKVHSLRN